LNGTQLSGDGLDNVSLDDSVEEITKEQAMNKIAEAASYDTPVESKESEYFKAADGAPKGMPAVGHTTNFPREDNLYRKKESLPYDEC